MVFVPSIYRTPEGRRALLEDDAALAAEETQLLTRLDEVRENRRVFARYLIELGMTPAATPVSRPMASSSVVSVPAFANIAPAPVTRPPKTWREFIAMALRTANRSLSNQEIIEMGNGTEFEDRFKAGPNGFYNTTRNMALAGELVKVGKRLYDPSVYAKVQAGELTEDIPVEDTRASVPSLIIRVLSEHGGALTAGGVITALSRIPEASAIAERNPALIRTHLTKMKQKAQLISDNGQYKLPELSREIPTENITLFPGTIHGS